MRDSNSRCPFPDTRSFQDRAIDHSANFPGVPVDLIPYLQAHLRFILAFFLNYQHMIWERVDSNHHYQTESNRLSTAVPTTNGALSTEVVGFEPTVPITEHGILAGFCDNPLCHTSKIGNYIPNARYRFCPCQCLLVRQVSSLAESSGIIFPHKEELEWSDLNRWSHGYRPCALNQTMLHSIGCPWWGMIPLSIDLRFRTRRTLMRENLISVGSAHLSKTTLSSWTLFYRTNGKGNGSTRNRTVTSCSSDIRADQPTPCPHYEKSEDF